MQPYAITHQGNERERNEDRYFIKQLSKNTVLLAVADGMGGEVAGELASGIAADTFSTFKLENADPIKALHMAFEATHLKIVETAAKNPNLSGMGTTLVAVVVLDQRAFWASCGDSRLYLFRQGQLHQITKDHNMPGMLLSAGEITKDQAFKHPMSNMLMRSLGGKKWQPDTGDFPVAPQDILLLSSDGLHGELSHFEIQRILMSGQNLESRCDDLLKAVLDAGGLDNITIIGVEL
jgi:protein phosphatase